MSETCETCRFWRGYVRGRVQTPGVCWRYPPTNRGDRFLKADDWCGEYQPRKETQS